MNISLPREDSIINNSHSREDPVLDVSLPRETLDTPFDTNDFHPDDGYSSNDHRGSPVPVTQSQQSQSTSVSEGDDNGSLASASDTPEGRSFPHAGDVKPKVIWPETINSFGR